MAKISLKGSAMLSPVPPALVSVGTVDSPNVLTVAWTGILASTPPTTYISVRKERFSHHIIKETGEFVINLCTVGLVAAADYCGVKSGKDTDKFKKCSLTAEKAFALSCPTIKESPLCLECKVREVVELGSHDMFIADIVAVDVDEEIMDKKGKIHLEKAGLAAYAHGEYFALGKRIGGFGYTVRKK